jgi:hypothetical protein
LLKSTLLKGVNSLVARNLDKSQRQIRKLKITVGKGISSWQQTRVTELSSTRCRQNSCREGSGPGKNGIYIYHVVENKITWSKFKLEHLLFFGLIDVFKSEMVERKNIGTFWHFKMQQKLSSW